MNYYSDESEWKWLFKHSIDWEKLIPMYYPQFPTEDGFNSKEEVLAFLEELLSSTGEWSANAIYERAPRLDKEGAGTIEDGKTIPSEALTELYNEAKELELFGLPLPRKFGGMEIPMSINFIINAQIARACISSCTQLAFFTSIADMIHRFCPENFQEKYIPQIIAGDLSGSMNLTEPGAGSDVGAVKTMATKQEDGSYLLNGTKTFITNGGGGVGFILARIKGAPEGLEGISMFFAEQEIENEKGEKVANYYVSKNEEKMGLHGSFTCEVVYENSKAYLVGEENKGFKYMLHLMNEARIAVGFQGLGAIESSLGYAKQYAQERVQFGQPIGELPLLKRNIEDYETERDAIRAMAMDTISYFDISQKLDAKKQHGEKLTREEKKLHKTSTMWVRKRVPLLKYYSCEAAVTLTQRAIQILGGYGFMQEYPVERIHRDSFAPLIYEGTSQIQALMALKDMVKYAMKDSLKFFVELFTHHPIVNLISAKNKTTKRYKNVYYRFKKKSTKIIVKTLWPGFSQMFNPKNWQDMEKVNKLMTHAETLCQALSYVETLAVLCKHANKDESRVALFDKYYYLILPRLEAIYKDWCIR